MPDIENIDLLKITKRLELIKSLISLEEENEIQIHISKLEQQRLTFDLDNIINSLREKSYSKAILFIEAFINKHHLLTIYIDPAIHALKFEIKVLETE